MVNATCNGIRILVVFVDILKNVTTCSLDLCCLWAFCLSWSLCLTVDPSFY